MTEPDGRVRAEGAPINPRSILWATAADPRSLLTGIAAGIMQLMLPGLGAGVTDHSNFFDDPFDRIDRSLPYIWGSIFTEDEKEGSERGKQIRILGGGSFSHFGFLFKDGQEPLEMGP